MVERRRTPRQKSLLRGVVYFDNIPFAADCLVRDLTEIGARIKFETPPAATADLLELHLPTKGQKLRGKVRWKNADEIGISFEVESASQGGGSIEDRMHRLEAEIATLKQLVKKLQRHHEPTADVA